MEKKEILNDLIYTREFLNNWLGDDLKQNPLPRVNQILKKVGIDFEQSELCVFYLANNHLTLFLETCEGNQVSFQNETPEMPKRLLVKNQNKINEYYYLKGFNVLDKQGELVKRHEDKIDLHGTKRWNLQNDHQVIHYYDAFHYEILLETPTNQVKVIIKYPEYLKDFDETVYISSEQIEDLLLNMSESLKVEKIYKGITASALKPGITYPRIQIEIQKQENIVEQIDIINGSWQTLKKKYNNTLVTINRNSGIVYETPTTFLQTADPKIEETLPSEVRRTRVLIQEFLEN